MAKILIPGGVPGGRWNEVHTAFASRIGPLVDLPPPQAASGTVTAAAKAKPETYLPSAIGLGLLACI